MKLSRGFIGWLIGLVAFAVVLGTGALAPSTASAAPPSIDPSSCGGEGAGGTYCSFETDGTDVVVGPNSCTVVGSCLNLGNGTRINAFGLPFLPGSCNEDAACREAGVSGGSFIAGNNSCNGYSACYGAGEDGMFEAGNGSCNGDLACQTAGISSGSFKGGHGTCNGDHACTSAGDTGIFEAAPGACSGDRACEFGGQFGSFRAGFQSCMGPNACDSAGSEEGSFVAGIHSCQADTACLSAGVSGSFVVGHDSCNVTYACEYAGQTGDGPSSVGSFSCNYSDNLYNTECTGDVSGSRPDVGDCMYNDPVTTAQQIACLFVDTPAFQNLQGILQSILSIFMAP